MSFNSYQPPFPWFGGKSSVADRVWNALGDVANYVEPFCGSCAVLLLRPGGAGHIETVNDADGLLANFWRALQHDSDAVAAAADNPVNEADLHARHLWLLGEKPRITERLMGDPEFYDAKAAGWWAWGQCCWIGSGWCSGNGPWVSEDGEMVLRNPGQGVNRQLPHLRNPGQGVNRQLPHLRNPGQGVNRQLPHLRNPGQGVNRQLPHLRNPGQGVNRQLPHLRNPGQGVNRQLPHLRNPGQGVNRQLPHLRNPGQGVNRQLPHLRNPGQGVNRQRPHLSYNRGQGVNLAPVEITECAERREWLHTYLAGFADRLRNVRVCCGDWSRVCGPSVTFRHGVTGVFLDPPYANTATRTKGLYANDCEQVAHAAREWAIEQGANPLMRIVLAGYQDEHAMPSDWRVEEWEAVGGYGLISDDATSTGRANKSRERLWMSPACCEVNEPQKMLFD